MRALVDTPVWSLMLRRPRTDLAVAQDLGKLVREGTAILVGPIRQELLSGVREKAQFERLRKALEAFPDDAILAADYVEAARMFNVCRTKGVQGSSTDFLLCAIAARLGVPIFTLDRDFSSYAKHLSIKVVDTIE